MFKLNLFFKSRFLEKAKNLKGEELRIYAEKVALAFWNAIGSDEDEPEEL